MLGLVLYKNHVTALKIYVYWKEIRGGGDFVFFFFFNLFKKLCNFIQ